MDFGWIVSVTTPMNMENRESITKVCIGNEIVGNNTC